MIRNLYTAVRHPGTTHEQFVRRWRLHAGIAMSEPTFWNHIQRYAQYDAVADRAAFSGIDAEIDGVGALWWENPAGFVESSKSPASEGIIKPDGSIAFVRPRMRSVAIDEHFVRKSPTLLPIRVITFSNIRGDIPRPEALSRWNAWVVEALPDNDFAEVVTGQALYDGANFDLVTELGFLTLESARAGLMHWRRVLDEPTPSAVVTSSMHVVTKQRVIFDRQDYSS